jgi:hypothetical protein
LNLLAAPLWVFNFGMKCPYVAMGIAGPVGADSLIVAQTLRGTGLAR